MPEAITVPGRSFHSTDDLDEWIKYDTGSTPRWTLGPTERGVIISSLCLFDDTGRPCSWPPGHLHFALLFWDLIDFPVNSAVEIRDPDIEALKALGVVQSTRAGFKGPWNGDLLPFVAAHEGVFTIASDLSPGRWSSLSSDSAPRVFGNKGSDALCVALHRALCLPPVERPYEDILEFRAKRRDELLRLRHHLDTIAEAVEAAADSEAAFARKVDLIHAAISDFEKVTRERF